MRRLALLTLLALAAGTTSAQGTPPRDVVAVDTQPVPLQQVQPEYPEEARQAQIEGRVVLRLWIGSDGTVRQAVVLRSDNAIFDEAALVAARQWTFTPAIKDGRPVEVWVTLPIRFRANRPDALDGTWDEATRTFQTRLYQISLPEGFPQPHPVSPPGSDASSTTYGAESGGEGFVLIETFLPAGALADTSLAALRMIALGGREGMTDEAGAALLGEPEEIVTPERFVSRTKLQVPGEAGAVYYGLVDIVLPRLGTAPMVLLLLISPDPAALERASWHEALGTFRYLDGPRQAPFLPADPLALLNGEWQWEGASAEVDRAPFTLTVAADRQSIRLVYRTPITAPDGSRRTSFTYRVLGHEGAAVRTWMEGETRRLASGKPVGWDFVLRSEREFCWRQADLPEGTCTQPLVRVTEGGSR